MNLEELYKPFMKDLPFWVRCLVVESDGSVWAHGTTNLYHATNEWHTRCYSESNPLACVCQKLGEVELQGNWQDTKFEVNMSYSKEILEELYAPIMHKVPRWAKCIATDYDGAIYAYKDKSEVLYRPNYCWRSPGKFMHIGHLPMSHRKDFDWTQSRMSIDSFWEKLWKRFKKQNCTS